MATDKRLGYWLPRLLMAAFVISLVFPLQRYLTGMEPEDLLVWLSRLAWVLACVAVLAVLGRLGLWLGRRRKGGRS